MGTPIQDTDSEIPRVLLDESRRDVVILEKQRLEAGEDIDAGDLVHIDGGQVMKWDEDGTRPPWLLVALDARQRGMDARDDYPGKTYPEGTTLPVARLEGQYANLSLAEGEAVDETTEFIIPAGDGAVRAFVPDGDTPDDEAEAIGFPMDGNEYDAEAEQNTIATEVFY